jgi:hypothetical protein
MKKRVCLKRGGFPLFRQTFLYFLKLFKKLEKTLNYMVFRDIMYKS